MRELIAGETKLESHRITPKMEIVCTKKKSNRKILAKKKSKDFLKHVKRMPENEEELLKHIDKVLLEPKSKIENIAEEGYEEETEQKTEDKKDRKLGKNYLGSKDEKKNGYGKETDASYKSKSIEVYKQELGLRSLSNYTDEFGGFESYNGGGFFEAFNRKPESKEISKSSESDSLVAQNKEFSFEQSVSHQKHVSQEYVMKVKESVQSGAYETAKTNVLETANYLTGQSHGCAGCAVNQIYGLRDQIKGGSYNGAFDSKELLQTINVMDSSL